KGSYIRRVLKKPDSVISIDLKALIIETIKEAIPLIVIGSAIQLYQFVDQITFVNFMETITSYTNKELLVDYSYMISNPSKITM
ncbi:polysaccharide biosynthesis protein, partial [Streptococcus pyogenes]